MIRFIDALNAWGTPDFNAILRQEIERLTAEQLPLQQGLSRGSYSDGKGLSVMIISITDQPTLIRAKTGIFYSSIIAGCSCADDPTPVDDINEYCELQFDIDKTNAEATVTLLS